MDRDAPNKWCPVPGLPSFMYRPVPSGTVDPDLLERHVQHWLGTGDFDVERQAGFWLYTAYGRALPKDQRFLADRIMNLALAFPDHYEDELRSTIRGILATASRRAGAVKGEAAKRSAKPTLDGSEHRACCNASALGCQKLPVRSSHDLVAGPPTVTPLLVPVKSRARARARAFAVA